MLSNNSIFKISILALGLPIFFSCKKYLNEKYDKRQVIPSTYVDLQAILDESASMNQSYPALLELAADNYYLLSDAWASRNVDDRNNYIWLPDATYLQSWSTYLVVYNANVILGKLPTIDRSPNDQSIYDNIKGQALFCRSIAFYSIAQLYCKAFDPSTSSKDLGIPFRLSADVEVKTVRNTVEQTYNQITNDLKEAASLLPVTSIALTRPTKAAAFGILARTYLSMRDYVNAGIYADSALQLNSSLLDFNSLDPTSNAPIASMNVEISYYADLSLTSFLSNSRAKIDSTLYASYNADDLRKTVFFRPNADGTVGFKGSYDGTIINYGLFFGVATDEMLLTRAECYARAGNTDDAMADLNTLLAVRWKSGTFTPFSAADANAALKQVLDERRKELIYRGLRWTDLRRLNLEGANITPQRIINGTTYSLPPNDNRWVMLIPLEVINQSGLTQNPR